MFCLFQVTSFYLPKPQGVLVPGVKQLKNRYLRQQPSENIVGFCGARVQGGYGIGRIFRCTVLLEVLFPCLSEVLKQLKKSIAKGSRSWSRKNATESVKSRGKQAAGDVEKAAVNKVMTGRGRKKGVKRLAQGKTTIRAQTKKLKTSNKVDNYRPRWNGNLICSVSHLHR